MPSNDPFGGLPPEFSGEMRSLKMREAIMQAMLQGSMKQPEAPQTKGRFQGAVSPLSVLSGPLGALAAMKGLENNDKAYGELGKKYQEGASNEMAKYIQTRSGTPADTITFDQPTRPDGTGEPTEAMAAVPGDPRKAVMQAMMSQYPQVRDIGKLDYVSAEKANQPFTLAKGAVRVGPDGKVIAENTADSPGDIPMNVREWEYYKTLSKENQKAFLDMKRAPGFLDVGGGFVPRPTNFPVTGQTPPLPAATPQPTAPTLPGAPAMGPGVAAPVAAPATGPGGMIPKGLTPAQSVEHLADVAGAKTGATAEAKRDFNMMGLSDIIDEANGVLTGTTKPTSSGIGSVVDSVASVVGASPAGAAEADKLRAIGGALVAKMPRMEGPQSDFDVKNYKEMAGQIGNSNLPIERRLAALETVKKIWQKYDKSAAPATNAGPQPGTVQDGYRFKGGSPSDPSSWEKL